MKRRIPDPPPVPRSRIVLCETCRDPLSPGEAIEVVDLATGARKYVHRPLVDVRPNIPKGSCFTHGVRPVNLDRVRLVDPAAAAAFDARAEAAS